MHFYREIHLSKLVVMKNILFLFFLPFLAFSQLPIEFIQLKPVYTKNQIFNYTGSIQTWTVPPGITQIYIQAVGAQGGTAGANSGGKGGKITCYLNVNPGDLLYITVGGMPTTKNAVYGYGGNGGYTTGGSSFALAGGGLSSIASAQPISQTNALIIAGGGGGAAPSGWAGPGGNAGGLVGLNGAGSYSGVLTRGVGGNQTSGGSGGTGFDTNISNPTPGVAISGGNGGVVSPSTWNGGGGGGAGYFGGGGGAGGGNAQGSGGGGSSWTHSSCLQVSNISGINSGHGKVIIYYN
jgi:hypothetical protein